MRTIPTHAGDRVDTTTPRLAPSESGTFASRDACAHAARMLHDGYREDHTDDLGATVRTGELTDTSSIAVTPGGLVLTRRQRPDGREAHTDTTEAHDLEHLALLARCAITAFTGIALPALPPGAHLPDLGPLHGPPDPLEQSASWWSARSRSRMIRALASVDWTPVIYATPTTDDCTIVLRPAMVTLTYPGDWLTVAPDAATTKQHLRRLHERIRRLYLRNDLPDPAGPWKLEFQHRGAPHFHIYMPVPLGLLKHRRRPVRFRDWLSEAWADIVAHPDPDERARHAAAGTGIDFAEGARCSDPKRLAVYFTRHNAKGGKNKSYQHRLPPEWATAGRWWGTWGVERVSEEAPVTDLELVETKRLLRAWVRSQRVPGIPTPGDPFPTQPRSVPRQVPRTSRATGERRQRWVSRRYQVRSLAMSQGGFIISNDGPALAAMVARYLNESRNDDAASPTP